ncbi:RtcB family protein [Roseivirga sp. BDSF3-8]|uniref:RtcB family protein n=1 Tax=Roseivirga sp. BDSF3-8 TaxID=3241598 RepID=UPI003531D5A4
MGNQKLRGKDLSKIAYTSDRARSLAVDIISKHFKHHTKKEQLALLTKVQQSPEAYMDDERLTTLAQEFMPVTKPSTGREITLREEPVPVTLFGAKHIDTNAVKQMETALHLPISCRGALMPDAHQGYGLPVGAVLATKNAVIPYGVGLDIGCRMSLSIYEAPEAYLTRYAYQLKMALKSRTNFGTGGALNESREHEVLDREEFRETDLLRQLHGKAVRQLGTSGSGNHFVEWGIMHLADDNETGLPAGRYLALLSHSGSRGLGAGIARYYTDVALSQCRLPGHAKPLAWLDLDRDEGQAYWRAMNLAGDYAKACHDSIHETLGSYVGLKPLLKVDNHHNFAWKETDPDGEEYIVHRKGATPAAEGEWGIIPGSMTAPGYLVRGKGHTESLQSASHGAGRRYSRKRARESYTGSEMRKTLRQANVTLIGGGVDEAPGAYKDIETVMKSQKDLVSIQGRFEPKIVRMDKN